MTEQNPPEPPRKWLGFSKRELIVHGLLTVITFGIWLLVPAAIYTWRRGGGARKLSYGLWGVAGLVAVAVIWGLASDSPETTAASTTSSTTTAAETQPVTTEAITTEATTTEAEPPPPPTTAPATKTEPPDNGRMSDSEYELFSGRVAEVNDEFREYGLGLQKCGVLMQALELAEASDCVGESFSGVEEDALAAYGLADGFDGDVAKACRKALRLYKQRLDAFYNWAKSGQEAGENLQFEEFTDLASLSTTMTKRYAQARDWVLSDCAPR